MPTATASTSVEDAVSRRRGDLVELSHSIHAEPELAFAEHRSCAKTQALVAERGFEITAAPGGLDTAFRADYGSGPLVVRKDPNTAGSERDVAEQTKTMTSIRDNVNTVAKIVNTAESVRAQLAAWRTVVAIEVRAVAARGIRALLAATVLARLERTLFTVVTA